MSADKLAEAEEIFRKAMAYDRGNNPADVQLARSMFEAAAGLGHVRAKCELAGMMFSGVAGPKEEAHAMGLTLQAFAPGGLEPLESLSELLGSYAEQVSGRFDKERAEIATRKAEEALECLRYVSAYVGGLDRPAKG